MLSAPSIRLLVAAGIKGKGEGKNLSLMLSKRTHFSLGQGS